MSNNSNNNNVIVPQAKAAMEKFKMEAANEVGVQLELCGIQRQGKNAVWEKKKVISRRLIFSHICASVCLSIQRISLSRGTRIRVPILM